MIRIHLTMAPRIMKSLLSPSRFFPASLQRLRSTAPLFALVLLALCGFGLLADEVAEHKALPFDTPLLLALHAHAGPRLDTAMVALTRLGSGVVLLPLSVAVLLVLWHRRRRWQALYWACAIGGAALLNLLAKQVFQRARPALWPSPSPEYSFSFPSGHAMQSMAVCTAVLVLSHQAPGRWALRIACCLLAAGVGLSRLYLGVHFPSDVLAGWCASLGWCLGLGFIMRPAPLRESAGDFSASRPGAHHAHE